MSPATSDPAGRNEPDREAIRFLAWLKKRGAKVKCTYCRKKWEKTGITPEKMVALFGKEKIRVKREPGAGEKWIFLDDLPWADNLMMEYGEEVPHHSQWLELGK